MKKNENMFFVKKRPFNVLLFTIFGIGCFLVKEEMPLKLNNILSQLNHIVYYLESMMSSYDIIVW